MGRVHKIAKSTVDFAMFVLLLSPPLSVYPPFLPHGISQLSLEGFLFNNKLGIFQKCVEGKIKVSLKSEKNNGYII